MDVATQGITVALAVLLVLVIVATVGFLVYLWRHA